MKNVTKFLLMGVMALSLVSCGENSSGGGSDSSSSSTSGGGSSSTLSGQNFSSYKSLKSHFEKRSLATGVSSKTKFYHAVRQNGFNASFDAEFSAGICGGFLFWKIDIGDCDNNQASQYGSHANNLINNGVYSRIESSGKDYVDVKEAVDVTSDGRDYIYSEVRFDRDSNIYREMLGLVYGDDVRAVVSKAVVKLDNKTIKADYIEYFDNYGNLIADYVVSAALPTVANPVYSSNQRLQMFNEDEITEITVTRHRIEIENSFYGYDSSAKHKTISMGKVQL